MASGLFPDFVANVTKQFGKFALGDGKAIVTAGVP
jgi:hypothetical protein